MFTGDAPDDAENRDGTFPIVPNHRLLRIRSNKAVLASIMQKNNQCQLCLALDGRISDVTSELWNDYIICLVEETRKGGGRVFRYAASTWFSPSSVLYRQISQFT